MTPAELTAELRAERERLRAIDGVSDYVLDLITWACEYIDERQVAIRVDAPGGAGAGGTDA